MTINQLSVFVENKPGAVCAMTKLLAERNIDMRALSIAEMKDFGIVRLIVDDVYNAASVVKEAGYVYSLTPVIGVAIPDSPGGLYRVLELLTEAGSNVEYMYAFLGGKTVDCAYMIMRVEDVSAASAALAAGGIKTVDQEDIKQL